MRTTNDIEHVLYINLDRRTDRREHVANELPKINLNPQAIQRFPAICLPKKSGSAAIGCSMSHLKCLEMAKKYNWPHVLIVEDDITFTDPNLFMANFQQFMEKYNSNPTLQPQFDVLLIAGNNIPPYEQTDPFCVKVQHCQTTTGYLVNQHYYDTLINNIKTGVQNLLKDPEVRIGQQYTQYQLLYSIDKWWFQLQAVDNWYLLVPLTVTQRSDYSDIEERQVNYSPAMLDLNKQHLFNNRWKTTYPTNGRR